MGVGGVLPVDYRGCNVRAEYPGRLMFPKFWRCIFGRRSVHGWVNCTEGFSAWRRGSGSPAAGVAVMFGFLYLRCVMYVAMSGRFSARGYIEGNVGGSNFPNG